MLDWLKGADRWVADEAAKRAERYARPGKARNIRLIRSAGRSDAARAEAIDRIMQTAEARSLSPEEQANVRLQADQDLRTRSGRDTAARTSELIDQMNRGFGGYTQRGPLEALEYMTANRPMVRRTGLAAAALGAGAGMTVGAQQLAELMGFMQQGQQAEEDRSQPLTTM